MNNKELAYLADLASVVADGVIICTHPRAISAFFDNLSEERLAEICDGYATKDKESLYVAINVCLKTGRLPSKAMMSDIADNVKKHCKSEFYKDEYIDTIKLPNVKSGDLTLAYATYAKDEIFQYDMPLVDPPALRLGYFDEEHFAYLEDMDVGYRARIYGYENWYAPDAMVYHVGSGTSGSRYNQFKIRYSSRNNIYLIYKNMPVLQIIINLPFLVAGFGIKILFFTLKGFGREYIAGIKNGFQISKKNHKIPFKFQNLSNYFWIQVELWVNIFRRLCG